MLHGMSLRYPHVVAFRCNDDEKLLIDDVVASYPGVPAGTALRLFFTSTDVQELIRRRSHAYRVSEALRADAASRLLPGEGSEPSGTQPALPLPPSP